MFQINFSCSLFSKNQRPRKTKKKCALPPSPNIDERNKMNCDASEASAETVVSILKLSNCTIRGASAASAETVVAVLHSGRLDEPMFRGIRGKGPLFLQPDGENQKLRSVSNC